MVTAGNRTQEFTISPFLTPEQVSILVGVHVKSVRRWLNRPNGPIRGKKIGGRWIIPAAEVNRILPGSTDIQQIPVYQPVPVTFADHISTRDTKTGGRR